VRLRAELRIQVTNRIRRSSSDLMRWPPPQRGAPVRLVCTCDATILTRFPLFFLYVVRVELKGSRCEHLHSVNWPLERIHAIR
jgi:hypothetical protein